MDLVLGIDLDTSYFKAALFNRLGEMLGLGRASVEIDTAGLAGLSDRLCPEDRPERIVATLAAAGITDAFGNPLPDDYTFGFHCMKGDVDGNGKVDGADLAIWQQNYDPTGQNENTQDMGDLDGDSDIDGADLALWQQGYNPVGIREWIMDNEGPGYVESGTDWHPGSSPGYFGPGYRWTYTGAGEDRANWTITGLPAGTYEVYVTFPKHSGSSTDAPYEVYDDGTLLTATPVTVDQTQDPDDEQSSDGQWWEHLGSFTIDSGTLVVELSDLGDQYWVSADAVWVRKVDGGGVGGMLVGAKQLDTEDTKQRVIVTVDALGSDPIRTSELATLSATSTCEAVAVISREDVGPAASAISSTIRESRPKDIKGSDNCFVDILVLDELDVPLAVQ